MKDFFKVVAFLVGYLGYALLAITIFSAFDGKWYSSLLYAGSMMLGFGISAVLRDRNTCPCCEKK